MNYLKGALIYLAGTYGTSFVILIMNAMYGIQYSVQYTAEAKVINSETGIAMTIVFAIIIGELLNRIPKKEQPKQQGNPAYNYNQK